MVYRAVNRTKSRDVTGITAGACCPVCTGLVTHRRRGAKFRIVFADH